MKVFTKFLISLLLLTILASGALAQTDTMTVIFVTDTHSHLVPYGPKDENGIGKKGGIARVATVVKQLMANEKNPLFVHSGDLFVNDVMFNKFFGVPEFKILMDLGLGVMCVGNHEFDLTPDRLKATLVEAGVTDSELDMISADLDMTDDPELANMVDPYTIVPLGNLQVGLFGLTPDMANAFSKPAPDSITDFRAAAQTAVEALRPQCDIVIGITHLNVEDDDTLAATIPDIDLIIGGHSHTHNLEPRMIANSEGFTPVLRAGCYYQWVGKVNLAVSPSGVEILHHELITIDETVEEDTDVAAIVDSLVSEVNADPKYGSLYTEIIAESNNYMHHNAGTGYKDSPLGNLVTDAMRSVTETDIALDVDAWIAQPIYPSKLSGADIFQSIPYGYDEESGYGFKIVTFTLVGYMLKTALEFALHESLTSGDYNIQVSNMQVIYDSREDLGFKIKSMTIGGQPYFSLTTYSVTMSDGLARFLYLAGLSMVVPVETEYVEYDVVRDYIIANSPLNYTTEGRVEDTYETAVPTRQEDRVPSKISLLQNYPNPFNPETTILYQLNKETKVSLKIYNTVGQLIKTLVEKTQAGGIHTINWDGKDELGRDVTSGVYLYQLKSENSSENRKMLLVR
ncbi:5'-nucleotidase C-terminal domain-containing protein [candidate division KSB1 bacterium]|nr:5'-nucleotidase C-terminal domain-containing protein [candidate division KSB1 bacterium]